jgi:hypothetical protein
MGPGHQGVQSDLIRYHALAAATRAWESTGSRGIREQEWERLFQKALVASGRKAHELSTGPASAPWKVAVATLLKERSQASNPWRALQLGIKRPAYLSRLVSAARRGPRVSAELSRAVAFV